MSPAEIASARELKIGTVYNHLADLIGRGKIPIEEIVPEEQRRLIEEAVEEVGTFYLSPIKARLPEEIDYSQIRCVIASMEHAGKTLERSTPPSEDKAILERLMAWRREEAQRANQPPFFILSNTVLSAIAVAAPRDRVALAAVRGVSGEKCDMYGEVILSAIAEVRGDGVTG
jgi:superfamily II DNA helicase RecQ